MEAESISVGKAAALIMDETKWGTEGLCCDAGVCDAAGVCAFAAVLLRTDASLLLNV